MTIRDLAPDERALKLLKYLIGAIPIFVGIIYQILLYFDVVSSIYVVLTPPGYISPFVSLELPWWLVLTTATAIICLLAGTGRIKPYRLITPFYAYLVFLLILVKPV